MPLPHYGVLAGQVTGRQREAGSSSPHFQIHVDGGGTQFRVAVNVLSAVAPPNLLYVALDDFHHPMLADLPAVADGFTPLTSTPGGLALDFVRGNLFDPSAMRVLPPDLPGPDNDLADLLDGYIARAQADATIRLFAFGVRWGPEPGLPDQTFGFSPGDGVHDIHMNQGNSGRFTADDGVYQDGGLLLHFPAPDRWVAIFLAFQSQSWHTDDGTGHTLPTVPPPTVPPPTVPPPTAPGPADRAVRIVAALVNPVGPAPEAETVTLVNTTAGPVDLAGWTIADRDQNTVALPAGPPLRPGEALRVPLAPPVALGNHGGLVTLLDAAGLKVDGVAYTAADAGGEGRTVVF